MNHFDTALAGSLGFIYFGIGGSRNFRDGDFAVPGQKSGESQDWDLIGIVDSKEDIVSLALHRESQVLYLLGIMQAEYSPWSILEDYGSQIHWDVLRISGFGKDGSKRSLKLCSRQHLLHISLERTACTFGVLSARSVRYTHRYHPQDGHRIFVYQPLKLTENLSVLSDADFLSPKGSTKAANPGVTCDLFFTSQKIFEISANTTDGMKAALLRKWCSISSDANVEHMIPLLYRYPDFPARYVRRLESEFFGAIKMASVASEISLLSKLHDHVPECQYETAAIRTRDLSDDYSVITFLPATQGSWLPRYSSPIQTSSPDEDIPPFREASEQYRPSAFTSNSKGLFGELYVQDTQRWRQVFVKKSPHITDELLAFPDILRYFPLNHTQRVVAVDRRASTVYFNLFRGKILNQIRLDYYNDLSFLNQQSFRHAVDWFLDIELRRAEHVSDAYRTTLQMDPDAGECAGQRIHRFYFKRLEHNVRFIDFYSEWILQALGVQQPKGLTTSAFLELPLIINGVSRGPLRYYLDHARRVLDPRESGVLSSLPVAFGLGDGHGGNLMVTQEDTPHMMYIDYEVSGIHCPFLDMAKSIYNDAFFNVLYADLLCDDVSQINKSGVIASWDFQQGAVHIEYNIDVDTIGKVIALSKLDYVLLPLLESVARDSPWQMKNIEEVLSYGLFCCALLSRRFTARPDVFFLNLALGIRLAEDLKAVLREVFDWDKWHVFNLPSQPLTLVRHAHGTRQFPMSFYDQISRDIFGLLSSSFLMPEEVFLKRSEETFALHRVFSQKGNESTGTIINRISSARYLGLKIAPHTCIRESLFAEPRIDHHFAYSTVLASSSADKLLIDVGCCMGTDIRKLILDGYPAESILGLDIERSFFNLGHVLYNERRNAAGFRFRQADMLDPKFSETNSDLQDAYHFVHTANVIHLFGLKDQEIFFRNLVYLAKPGGRIWGRQVGLQEDEFQSSYKQPDGKGARFTIKEFCNFCLEITRWSLADINFEAQLVRYEEIRAPRKDKQWVLQWSIEVPQRKLATDRILLMEEI